MKGNPVLLGVDGIFCVAQFITGIISIFDDASVGWIICIIVYLLVATSTVESTRRGDLFPLIGHGLLLIMTIVVMSWDISAVLSWLSFVWIVVAGMVMCCPAALKLVGGPSIGSSYYSQV